MNEPIGFVLLTPEQIEELHKQGYNVKQEKDQANRQKIDQIHDDAHFWGIERSPLQVKLIGMLRNISNAPEFILSVITHARHEEDTQYMIDYISTGVDVDYSQLILQALYLCKVRKGEINPSD